MAITSTREELDHFVRTLSHDMSAHFMLLENSFSQLKKSLGRLSPKAESADELDGRVAHVEACLRESKRFLDDLHWLARTGAVEMEPGRVELAAVVDEVLFEQRESLAERNIRVDVHQPLPAVWCNAARLKQIVTNLVRNAAIHGCDPQHPRISILPWTFADAAGATREPAMVTFQIHDNGPGIDRRYRREIFLPGRRLAPADAQGSGMGLAIVSRIVEHYGGSVYVDPDCHAGTAIVVSLPEAAGPASGTSSQPDAPAEVEGRRWQLQLDGRHGERPRQRHGTLSPRQRQQD